MKFFKIPFQSGGDDSLDPRQNKLQQYIQSQSVEDMTRLASEISPEVKQIVGTNVQALLGYLPNQDFNTTIMANKESLQNLLASSMITGYFMHAMEVRMAMDRAMQVDPAEQAQELESLESFEPDGKEILLSPETLFEGLDSRDPQQPGEAAEPSGPQEGADKLNIQVEINTQMAHKDLTKLLRELHKFQATETEDNSAQSSELDTQDPEPPCSSETPEPPLD